MILFILIFMLWFTPARATTYFNNVPNVFVEGAPGDTCISNPAACARAAEVNANFNQLVSEGAAAAAALRTMIDSVSGATVPSGAVLWISASTCPPGFILANGTAGAPDLRGVFIRGLDLGAGRDSGRTLNSYQLDQFLDHQHDDVGIITSLTGSAPSNTQTVATIGGLSGTPTVTGSPATGSTETAPAALVLLGCYKP